MPVKVESRIIPEETGSKLYMQNLKAYDWVSKYASGLCVLDVGCGDGYGTAFLAKTAKSIIGVDYEKDVAIEAAKKYKADNLEYLFMDATELKFNNNEFDIVCSFQVIEHLPENKLTAYLNELRRVLKTGEHYFSLLLIWIF